jgi:hypothetical protein
MLWIKLHFMNGIKLASVKPTKTLHKISWASIKLRFYAGFMFTVHQNCIKQTEAKLLTMLLLASCGV